METYTSLNCNFFTLMMSCDIQKACVLAATKDMNECTVDHDIEWFVGQVASYENAVMEILNYGFKKGAKPMGFAVSLVPKDSWSYCDWINVSQYNHRWVPAPEGLDFFKWKDKHHQTFSATFADWEDHLSREVLINGDVEKLCPTLEHLVAEILWEMTFSGFTGKKVQSRFDDLKKIVKKCKDDVKNGKCKRYASVDEMMEDLKNEE
jgi:hypothetical protein